MTNYERRFNYNGIKVEGVALRSTAASERSAAKDKSRGRLRALAAVCV